MKIRRMKKSDLNRAAQLNFEVFRDAPLERVRKVFREAFDKAVRPASLVAEEKDELVGAVLVEKKSGGFTPDNAYVTSFFVKKEWRGKGVGKALLTKCLAALKKKGIAGVSLTVDVKNKRARRMYEKNGLKLFKLMYLRKF